MSSEKMRPKVLKVAVAGAAGFVIPFLLLSAVTKFVLLPSFTLCSLVVLSAIAAYIPRKGIPFALSILVLGAVFSISLFLISPAFSAAPQAGGSFLIPLGATAIAFASLVIYGNRRCRAADIRDES